MADPDPPQPTPFPIRIVQDPALPPPPEDVVVIESDTPARRKTDAFYPAWESFLSVEPKRAKRTSRSAKKLQEEKAAISQGSSDGLKIEENAAKSYEQAAAECRRKVDAIVEECERLNQKYRDALFDLEAGPYCLQSLLGRFPKAVDKIDAPPWIKRVEDIFDNPQFFIDGATATDVHQGSSGDCWFLASLMAVSAKEGLVEDLCVARNEKVGVYGFVFYRDGEWVYEVIDDKLFLRVGDDDDLNVVRDWGRESKEGMSINHDGERLKETLQTGGEALYFSHCKSNETWLPLIEKAYAKAHGDYFAIEGGFASEGIEDLTGGVGVVINPEDIMDKDRFWRDQLMQVNRKYLFGGGSKHTSTKGFVGGHAYAVLQAWEEGDLKLLKLRNPWGEVEWEGDWSDGSKLWTADMMTKLNHSFGDDGIFWISYKDFLKHFPSINRVRLFDKEWSVSQQWTAVTVPWTVDYLDTKFEVTIDEKGPVVFVLSQPDDRYFYGMRGRYLFSMHFRLYKEGEDERYIVRSMHNSGNETVFTRSVSAEVEDLEPGKYFVIFKVTAVRTQQMTAEEVIAKYAIDKKEKLLNVGRRFDYAQSKGNLKGIEQSTRKDIQDDARAQIKSRFKRARILTQRDKERARKKKQRVDEAMREKRKAFIERQNAKRDAARKQQEERRRQRHLERQAGREGHEEGSESSKKSGEAVAGSEAPSNEESKPEGVHTPTTEEESTKAQITSNDKDNDAVVDEPASAVVEGEATVTGDSKEEGPTESTSASNTDKLEAAVTSDSKAEGPTEATQASNADKLEAASESQANEPREEKSSDAEEEISKDMTALSIKDNRQSSAASNRSSRRRSRSCTRHRNRSRSSAASTRSSRSASPEGYHSPPEQLSELDDDDFDWDSDMDGPVYSDTSSICSSTTKKRRTARRLGLFDDDRWDANVVLGLRVYCRNGTGKIRVIKDEDEEEMDEEMPDV
ncbi:cysteine proteinase [Polychaeton citri CBS 116435]|uniref:Cysteine proteinase n=1 Tax=Polychaeton citri CBS 116435 TaxID=1314669 RepID=A0A9P4UTM3_9PEZI|nr:cysteine proteinase [Polychaeton citri CBS 116435]